MKKSLQVFLYQMPVGRLIQNDNGLLSFCYLPTYLADSQAIPLSVSLPLRREEFNFRECSGFFSGLLPEESNRQLIARNLGISANNDFSLLAEIGGECAGAVSFLAWDQLQSNTLPSYRRLSGEDLVSVILQLPARPMLAGEKNVRLSLAGAQTKLAVWAEGKDISVPLSDAPSSHILKPESHHFEGLVHNEGFCMMLAAACGLQAAKVEIRQAGGLDFLLIERYDRRIVFDANSGVGVPSVMRLHQEDFCQALGIRSDFKYEKEGGPSFKQCFELINRNSQIPMTDRQRMLDAMIFNFLIGNCDAHGKNFSFLFEQKGEGFQIRLAPLYDLVCTSCYPTLDQNLAMSIGGKFVLSKIKPEHFELMAKEVAISVPLMKKRFTELTGMVLETLPSIAAEHPMAEKTADWIKSQCHSVWPWFQ